MKKALVISLLVLGVGLTAAAEFTGSWMTDVCFEWDTAGDISLAPYGFRSILYVDYTICNWTFGSNVVFTNGGINNLWFDASGSLGAFSGTALLLFDPAEADFLTFEVILEVAIAGVDFYTLFGINNNAWSYYPPYCNVADGIGVGMAFGLTADVGDCTFGAELQFGAGGSLYFVYFYGVQGAYGYYDGWSPCPDFSSRFYIEGGFACEPADCDMTFTGLDFYVDFPVACLDVLAIAEFGCEVGFERVCFVLQNIDLGMGWVGIDSMAICYQTGYKSVCVDFDLTLGDAICVTPYIELIQDGDSDTGYLLEGIEVNAITLTYNYNGVTFKAGEIFDHAWEREGSWITAWYFCEDATYTWYFDHTGGITRYSDCAFRVDKSLTTTPDWVYPNEFFGVSIDGDSCCGGSYDVDLYNFFMAGGDPGEYGIFGWVGTYAGLSVDIGTNTTISAGMIVSWLGVESLCFDFGFSW